jgi:pyruvate carboxylase
VTLVADDVVALRSPQMKKLRALNRSEIAIAILRLANELGLRSVAVYSQEDRLALAKEKRVDAIHPGYGFCRRILRCRRRAATVESSPGQHQGVVAPTSPVHSGMP